MAGELAVLTVRVNADTEPVRQAFIQLNQQINNVTNNFSTMGARAVATGNLISGAFTKALSIASSALQGFGSWLLKSIDLSAKANDAMIGLISVGRAYGISSDQTQAAVKRLTADGLLPMRDAAKGLQNFLMTGFGLKEAEDLMNAFKDSAVHGRQEALNYGQAVRTASEGIKNMRSQQVDNVGITKNLSVIMKEAGFQMADLTDKVKGAEARHALYVGILRESAAQHGAAARSVNTYAGSYIALQTAYQNLRVAIGDFITRNAAVGLAMQAVGKFIRYVTDSLQDQGKGYKLVADLIYYTIKAMQALLGALNFLQTGLTLVTNGLLILGAGAAKVIDFIGTQLIKLIGIAAKVPGGMEAIGLAGKEITDLALVVGGSRSFLKEYQGIVDENNKRTVEWDNKIQGAQTSLGKLADAIAKLKNLKIDLGDLARPPGGDILDPNDVGGIDKAAEKRKKALAKLIQWPLPLARNAQQQSKLFFKQQRDNFAEFFDFGMERLLNKEDMQLRMVPFGAIYKDWFKKNLKDLKDIQAAIREQKKPMADAFGGLIADLPRVLSDAIKSGSLEGFLGNLFGGLGESIGQHFTKQLIEGMQREMQGGKAVTGMEKALGNIGVAATSAVQGFTIGQGTASKTKGFLGGAATGALAGLPFAAATGGLSVAVGAAAGGIAGLIGGAFGSAKKAQEARQQLQDAKKALLDQYGGFQKLKKAADAVGVSIEKAYNAKTIQEFDTAVKQLNKALDDQKARIAALGTAAEAVNKRADILAAPFRAAQKAIDDYHAALADDKATKEQEDAATAATAKMAETAQRSQQSFETLGLVVRDTFAGLVRETGNAMDAILKLAPSFQVLQDGVEKWGLTSTPVIDQLIAMFKLVNDEAFKPLFEQISADAAIMKSLSDAGAITKDTFLALAADIGQGLAAIEAKGGDMAQALALSAPVLQTLWELQQKYGLQVDDTTQKYLDQAREQGLIGDQFKSVNEKILDVLIAIGDVLNAKLPQYFKNLKGPADQAAQDIEDSFNKIDPEPVHIRVKVDPYDSDVPGLAGGGIVRRPTLAMIGESGPEAVVPLSGAGLGVSGTYITDIYLDGERIARSTAKRMPSVLRGVGVS